MQTRPHLFLWRGSALVIGTRIDSLLHNHYATQITVGIAGPFRARFAASDEWQTTHAALFGPNQAHAIDSAGQALAHLFVEAGPMPSTLLADFDRAEAFAKLAPAFATPEQLTQDSAAEIARHWLQCARSPEHAAHTNTLTHPRKVQRIAQALDWIAAHPEAEPSGAQLAQLVHLSASRFTHLFREQTGLSLSRYLLWSRLLNAIDCVAQGANMTEAAHAAGFADLAHMSRSFRAVFGITPSELLKMTIAFRREGLFAA